ncbi:hypothetical protein RO575_19605 [Methylomonas sp. MO1]|uniref:hypothetical protein n=1 Tax=unclassified Methylomonas TaxID=2608980 RepID=UPI00047CA5C2|nr:MULTISPECIES: hypothetical protein [unclassified Methylomonas]MDT4291776.1 hypothetical protein [Methylomonas sp. MO1]
MNTENQEHNNNSDLNTRDLIDLFDDIVIKTERARCILELVFSAMENSELLPAIGVVIDELTAIDRSIKAWDSHETPNA